MFRIIVMQVKYNKMLLSARIVAIWVWVINLQDTVNAMYIEVKTPEARSLSCQGHAGRGQHH